MKAQKIDYQTFKKAIGLLKADKNVNVKEFCEQNNIKYPALNNAMRGTAAVQPEWIEKIGGIYPDFYTYMNISPSEVPSAPLSAGIKSEIMDCRKEVQELQNRLNETQSELLWLYKKLVEKGIKLE